PDDQVREALRTGRFVLLSRSPEVARAAADRSDRVVTASPGAAAPAAVLIRPDGYVAWASDRPDPAAARRALAEWVGPAGRLRTDDAPAGTPAEPSLDRTAARPSL
ncbi:MAG TPA: FAD-dependent oxidoreductase, partial [Streptomyces sp.]